MFSCGSANSTRWTANYRNSVGKIQKKKGVYWREKNGREQNGEVAVMITNLVKRKLIQYIGLLHRFDLMCDQLLYFIKYENEEMFFFQWELTARLVVYIF